MEPFDNMTIRFYIIDRSEAVDSEIDVIEVDEDEFLEAEGTIEYERHTVFQNGVSQICLTKNPFAEC